MFLVESLNFLIQERTRVSRPFTNTRDKFWTGGKDHDGDDQLTWTGKLSAKLIKDHFIYPKKGLDLVIKHNFLIRG